MKKIIVIIFCLVGIVYIYMVVENLEKVGKVVGVEVKVEIYGFIGIENELIVKDIEEVVGVIIVVDIKIDKIWFGGKLLIIVGV